jgi:micrococcal nuclease
VTPALLAAAFICAHPGVIDGDTLACRGGQHVRVWGIQAPERYMETGPASTRAMAHLIQGHNLTCYRKGRSYNRTVARCFLPDGRDIAREMVNQGQAVDWPNFSRGYYAVHGATSLGGR